MVDSGLKHESFLIIASYISFGYFDGTVEPGYPEGRIQNFQTEGICSELLAFGATHVIFFINKQFRIFSVSCIVQESECLFG